jgi:hypothetical protein
MVRLQPFPRQEIAEPPIAKPPPRGRQLTQPLPQVSIVRTPRLIPRNPPGNSDQVTRPALAQPVTATGIYTEFTLQANLAVAAALSFLLGIATWAVLALARGASGGAAA